MHELAITESVRDIALRHAEAAGAARISDIHLVIGQLSSVVDESVQFYWDIITAGTIAEGGMLHFRRVQAKLACRDCGEVYTLPGRELTPCPQCFSSRIDILAGNEFHVESIDIETEALPAERTPP